MENNLNYIDVGKGEITLVFLHYFGGSSNSWSEVIGELSHKFRCIAIDLPGFGNSQRKTNRLSVSYCSNEVARVIHSLKLKQYVLIGHSMGGKIALSFAAMQPSGLTSLVLVAPSAPTPEPMADIERMQLLNAFGDKCALETSVNNITAQPLSNSDIENTVNDNLRASYTSWHWWTEEGSREDISSQMSTIRVPVLVISGAADPKFSTHFLHEEMVKYFSTAAFTEIPNAGHLLPIETPLKLAQAIAEFTEYKR